MLNFAKIGEGKSKIKALLKPLVIPFAKLVGVNRCNKLIDNLSRSIPYEQANKVGCIMWGIYGTKECMKKMNSIKQLTLLLRVTLLKHHLVGTHTSQIFTVTI